MKPFPSEALLAWYAEHGRRHLPWRQTRDPYRVLVSELMLQQTQVERVIPLFEAFVARFPSFEALASAPASEAVRAWRGLGYNSRAVRLHALARAVVAEHGGALPSETAALRALPGIGAYTAAAVRAFAFELDDAAVDVNLRRVVQRVAFGAPGSAPSEATLDALAARAVPPGRAHAWNSAMMDLGAMLCTARIARCLVCPLRAACDAAPLDVSRTPARAAKAGARGEQNALPFERTMRFLRGRVIDRLRDVPHGQSLLVDTLQCDLAHVVPGDRLHEIPDVVAALAREGLVTICDRLVHLRE